MNDKEKQTTVNILEMVNKHRKTIYLKINEELVSLYYEIGELLSNMINKEKWGHKNIETISKQIKQHIPTIKGFERSNLYRMVQFYETYRDNVIVSPLVRKISWTNNLVILHHKSSIEEKEFYIRLCIKNNYSKRELERQIASHYYERYLLSDGNELPSEKTLIDENDYPNTRILEINDLSFLDLPSCYGEKDVRDGLVNNIRDFILEIGKDFSFIGKEYRITVGNTDYYIDLLFFNRYTNSLVAFELKIDKFRPEYLSKMNFYLEALDRQERRDRENPSIGIILCSEKDQTVVEYAMSKNPYPVYVSEYITKTLDKKMLENKIIQIRNLFDNADRKL